MKKMIQHSLLLLLLFAFMTACGNEGDEISEENSEPQEEEVQSEPAAHADFVEQAVFTNLDGEEVSMSEFKGKVVMIDFWETWCKPCLASFPTLQELQEEYPESFVVLAVTPGFTDSREDARKFADNHDYEFTYLMDSNGLHQDLEVQGIPFKVFVDANGEFIRKEMGSFGPDEDYKKVKEIIEKHKGS